MRKTVFLCGTTIGRTTYFVSVLQNCLDKLCWVKIIINITSLVWGLFVGGNGFGHACFFLFFFKLLVRNWKQTSVSSGRLWLSEGQKRKNKKLKAARGTPMSSKS